ncbi:MAG: hypothetical protein HZC40_08305 [Chloroflexi bacterium]|nr:hypothetical protein [Chloroflexota bacterium]
MFPYLLMTALFIALAALSALETSLANLNLVAWFNGLRWLRVHFVTLGILVELAFGILPALVAARAKQARPATRWDIWILLNAGFIALIAGIPLINPAIIFAGGTLVFSAVILLARQLLALKPVAQSVIASEAKQSPHPNPPPRAGEGWGGRPFYLAGLAFLSLGIIFGTGLWLGWGEFLRAASPKEIHLHANLWGFTSLTFAGLLIDLYPGFAKRALALPRSLNAILGLFIAGDSALILAPWIGDNTVMLGGLVLHHAATGLLVYNFVKPVIGNRDAWNAGLVHLVAAYTWILAGLAIVPITVFSPLQVPLTHIEAEAPLILVFGWVLQFAFALAPYIFARAFAPAQPARLGGNALSLLALNLGTACIVAAVLSEEYQARFDALAFALWAIALVPIARAVWRHTRDAFDAVPAIVE